MFVSSLSGTKAMKMQSASAEKEIPVLGVVESQRTMTTTKDQFFGISRKAKIIFYLCPLGPSIVRSEVGGGRNMRKVPFAFGEK